MSEDDDALDALTTQAHELVTQLNRLNRDSGRQLERVTKRNRFIQRTVLALAVSLTIDVAVTLAVTVGLVHQASLSDQISTLTNRLDVAQTVQRQKALCPLYQVFLDSESAAARRAAPDPAKYDRAFAVIRSGYQALNCAEFITAPTPAPTIKPSPSH